MTPEKLQEIRGVHSAIDLKNASDSQIICTPGDMVIERGLYKMRRKNEDVRTPHKLDDYEKMCSEVVVYKLKDIDGSED